VKIIKNVFPKLKTDKKDSNVDGLLKAESFVRLWIWLNSLYLKKTSSWLFWIWISIDILQTSTRMDLQELLLQLGNKDALGLYIFMYSHTIVKSLHDNFRVSRLENRNFTRNHWKAYCFKVYVKRQPCFQK